MVAKLAELDMIVADLERANSRVITVERRNVRLRLQSYLSPACQLELRRSYFAQKLRPSKVAVKVLTGTVTLASPNCVPTSPNAFLLQGKRA